MSSPFHEGERSIQERVGETAMADGNGRVISGEILPGALKFIEQQNMLVLTSLAPDGTPWPHLLFGAKGFANAPRADQLEVDLGRALVDREDPLFEHLAADARLGVLVIELGSRRRLRINGRLADPAVERWLLEVDETYPNCPKYIQKRQVRVTPEGAAPVGGKPTDGRLGDEQRAILAASDTAFVASAHPEGSADASHRGGVPGFMELLSDPGGDRVRMPDYSGNSLFNTLGNFATHPRGGLLVADFENRRLLQLVGEAALLFDHPDPEDRTGGTGRFWELKIERWRQIGLPARIETELLEPSPFNPIAG